jgi:hypothetical protein
MARHNKEMTTETKQMILRLKREGYAHRKIAEIIGRDHSTITKLGRGSLSFTMFVKSLKVSLLLTFTERKITRSPRSVTNFFLPVLGLFSTEFLS